MYSISMYIILYVKLDMACYADEVFLTWMA